MNRSFIFIFLSAELFLAMGCNNANVQVSGFSKNGKGINIPGFSTDVRETTVTNGTITVKARVASTKGVTLSAGGITLTNGAVK